ncbi:MAG: DUF4982 domain-containing protein [Candidatus Hydrogenedentes bacterium]|nr:DUF4982 domain-containing protein [Candidatus Hydrogenedentota bacterium]
MRVVESRDFSQGWLFHSGATPWWQPTGEKFDAVLERWRHVCLPHSFNAEDTFTPARSFYTGVCWYRKTFTLSKESLQKAVFIEFGAAYSLADVWVNERYLGQFMGGFTGFGVDASDVVREGENLIAVKVDNSHDPDILPGIEVKEMDYTLYGGLYREASLVITDKLHIARHGISVTTSGVTEEVATLHVRVAIHNARDTEVEYECRGLLFDPSGALVGETCGRGQLGARAVGAVTLNSLEISRPKLWSVDSPELYSFRVDVQKDGSVVDTDEAAFGVRWFEFTADHGFFLNGKPVKLRGLNRHQDYPGLGNALPPRLQVRDAEILKEMGANFVRLSHYPQHPAFLDACEIARDRNHPSVILWGLLNEGRSKGLFERLHRVAKASDSTRPTVYAENHPLQGKELGSVFVPDVLGLNYELEHIDDIRATLPTIKFVSSETTNYEHRRRGDFQHDIANVKRYKQDTDIVEGREFMAGMALWSMHDYGTDYELSWPIQNSGALDCYRLPKAGYWYLRARWSTEPVVRIIGHWNWAGQEGKTIPVCVCANADSVELFLNEKSLGTKSDRYLTQWDVAYAPGALRAVAHFGSATVEHSLATAGNIAAIHIETSTSILRADGADTAEITVTIVDAQGKPALTEDGHAAFRVEGPATLRGIAGIPVTTVLAGTGRIALQAGSVPGPITVRASYRGLAEVAIALETG